MAGRGQQFQQYLRPPWAAGTAPSAASLCRFAGTHWAIWFFWDIPLCQRELLYLRQAHQRLVNVAPSSLEKSFTTSALQLCFCPDPFSEHYALCWPHMNSPSVNSLHQPLSTAVQNGSSGEAGRGCGGPPSAQSPARSRVSQQVPQGRAQFWAPPRTQTPPWETCSGVWHGINFFPLWLNGISYISVCAHRLLACPRAPLGRSQLLHCPPVYSHTRVRCLRAFSSPGWTTPALSASPRSSRSKPSNTFTALHWTHSRASVSLAYWGAQDRTQHSGRSLPSAGERSRITPSPRSWRGAAPDTAPQRRVSRTDAFSPSQQMMPRALQVTAEQPGMPNAQFFEYIPYGTELRFFNTIVKIM